MNSIYWLLWIVLIIFYVAAEWKIYTKANQPGWAVIIPIYNIIVLLKIIGKPWWWLLLLCIPVANIVFGIIMLVLLAKSFGKDVGFAIGLIFLSFIFIPILGFGKAEYKGPAGLVGEGGES
jgi:hypothetical protein